MSGRLQRETVGTTRSAPWEACSASTAAMTACAAASSSSFGFPATTRRTGAAEAAPEAAST